MACKGCGNQGDKMTVDPNGERLTAVFMKPGMGKSMARGRATKESLGYIERMSVVENIHEADIAADPGRWVCVTCGQQFTIHKETAWCNNCTPRAGGRRDITQLKPKPASERIRSVTGQGQPHPNFAGMQKDPWGEQKDVSARQQPNYGGEPAQALPPPPGTTTKPRMVSHIPPPPVPGQKKSTIPQIQEARKVKEEAFGLPVVENALPPPPAPLMSPPQSIDRGVKEKKPVYLEAPMAESIPPSRGVNVAIGEVVDTQYANLLARQNINTLYDAAKAGHSGLVKVKGIGDKTAEKIITAATTTPEA